MEREGSPARLLIADDHALVREGFRAMLANEKGIEVVGEAEDGRRAVELTRTLRPDLVLMDVRMPEMDGLEATRLIKREHLSVSVLVVTTYDDPDYLLEAVKAGAAGYVLKGATKEQLVEAVHRALSGEPLLDPALSMRLLKRLAGEESDRPDARDEPAKPLVEALTPRELEVLELLVRGKTNREIASELFSSEGTVKLQVRHIIRKLGTSDRTQAAVRATELGLVSPEGA
jgi:DNA-binding NarL/FixJ family response regulator